eukprot:4631789-Alexandrium_andersonii.AAC.1
MSASSAGIPSMLGGETRRQRRSGSDRLKAASALPQDFLMCTYHRAERDLDRHVKLWGRFRVIGQHLRVGAE